MAEEKKQSCGCTLKQLIANEECSPAPAGLGNTVYFALPDKQILKCSGTVTIDTDEGAKGPWPESYEITGECLLRESPDALMRMLSRPMRFDRRTLRRLFHAVTHHKQVWFDVVIEFQDGTVDEGGLIAKTPHQLRFLLNKIHHIRTRYKISDRED
jgi:hypothetical protein